MPTSRLSPIIQFACLAVAVTCLVVLWSVGNQDFATMAVVTTAIAASCVTLMIQRWGHDLTRGPLLYLVLFLLFHLGLVWTLGISGEQGVVAISPTAYSWLHTAYFQPAVNLVALATVVFTVACMFQRPQSWHLSEAEPLPPTEAIAAARLATLGVVLEVVGLAIVGVTIAQSGGLGLLLGGYLTFLEQSQSSGVAYGVWAIGIGSCLSQLGPQTQRRAGLTIFAVYALTLFPLGLRGSVLFPAVVLLATRSMTGRRPPTVLLTAGALVVLALAAVVRTTRTGGTAQAGESWYSGALSTVTELGFSLRPTTEVLRWQDGGLEQTHFVSFFAVPIRLIEKFTGWHGGAPAVDQRLFNVKINALAGPIGGSPVAEAYDAAGTFGVILVMVILAVVISRISRRAPRTALECAMFPVVLLPLVIAVRNSFAPVLPQMAIGIVVSALVARAAARSPKVAGSAVPRAR